MSESTDPGLSGFSQEAERWRHGLHTRTGREHGPLGFRRPDPEEEKVLSRIFTSVVELERLDDLELLGQDGRDAVARLLQIADPQTLKLDGGLQLLDGLDQILVGHGDAPYLCRRAELAIYQQEGTTTLLTWEEMFGDKKPCALKSCREGRDIDPTDLESLRAKLSGLLHARSDLYGVHKARLRMKKRLFVTVTMLLVVLFASFALVVAMEPVTFAGQVLLVALAGGIGATLSGAFKLRDALTLGSELREFSSAAILQPIIGAAFALVVLLILESGLLVTSGSTQWAVRGVLGFLAGFSEPFALGVVARITS